MLAKRLEAVINGGDWDNYTGGFPDNFAGNAARDLYNELKITKCKCRELTEAILG